ncbi:MAG: hypothetical protein ACXWDM_11505 [Nocardioides sp.]
MRLSPAVLAVLLPLGLTACGGGSATDPGAATSVSTGSPSTGETRTDEPAEPEVLDPCAVVPREQWEPFLTKLERDKVVLTRDLTVDTEGILLAERQKLRYSCSLSFEGTDGFPALEWGYYAGQFTGSDLVVLLDGAGGTEIKGVDYIGYTTGDITSSDAYGTDDQAGFFVTRAEKYDSVLHSDTRAARSALVEVLTSLAEANGGLGQLEVELPSFCPAADGPEVTALLGKPAPYARGGIAEEEGYDWCMYRDPDSQVDLRLDVRHLEEDEFDSFYAATRSNPNGVEVIGGGPGPIRMISLGDEGSGNTVVLDPDSDVVINVTLRHLDDPKRRSKLDREAFLGMTDAFAAERARFHSSH